MHYSGFKRHYLTVSTPGGRDTLSVRSEPNAQLAKTLTGLAHDIIVSDRPQQIPRCSETPTKYYCKEFCSHSATCHSNHVPLINCRTCAHSTPHITDSNEGMWRCHIHNTPHDIPLHIQRQGCPSHIYNPAYLDNWAEAINADPTKNTITYMHKITKNTFTNGNNADCFSSLEIQSMDNKLLGDKNIIELKKEFEARVL